MDATQFASLDAATMFSPDTEYKPAPAQESGNVMRRSLSIFSRRGTETPEPQPPFIAQAVMRPSRQMTERQKSWIGRSRSICGSPTLRRSISKRLPKGISKDSKPKGTILNAVPPAKTIQMTPLEEEMATSPNEEIMSAISESLSANQLFSPGAGTVSQHGDLWNQSMPSLIQRTTSVRQKERDSRIGVWVDGVVHWDNNALGVPLLDSSIEEETGFTPIRPELTTTRYRGKPQLSVVIPTAELKNLEVALAPKPQRPIVPVAPANIVSQFTVPHLTPTPVDSKDITPIDSEVDLSILTPERSNSHDHSDREQSRASQSSTSSGSPTDGGSQYTKRSSATSIEPVVPLTPPKSKKSPSTSNFSLLFPQGEAPDAKGDLNKPLPRRPFSSPGFETQNTSNGTVEKRTRSSQSVRFPEKDRLRFLERSRSMTKLDLFDEEFMRSSPYHLNVESASPTLSQAEQDLEAHLTNLNIDDGREQSAAMSDDTNAVKPSSDTIGRSGSVRSVMQPPERAPTIPRRSRKRDWRVSRKLRVAAQSNAVMSLMRRKSESAARTTTPAKEETNIRRAASMLQSNYQSAAPAPPSKSPARTLAAPEVREIPKIVIDDGLVVVDGPSTIRNFDSSTVAAISAASAEEVLLSILSSLTSLNDLYNTAMINKGMYRVFKENELSLLSTVAYNESAPAWEFREWNPPEGSTEDETDLEHTPISYKHAYLQDALVIGRLKTLLLERCQTAIRRGTSIALTSPTHPDAQRFNDAFWRIWCFCKIFGSDKGREDDITGQLDWLKGGLLANNQSCAATVNTNLDFEMGSVLLNAPEYFAKGNPGGLLAPQLFDMMELWTSLSSLLQGYLGRTDQARKFGVFDGIDIEVGDFEREDHVLDEWIAYILTLGPAAILAMAEHASNVGPVGFALARANGWTQWCPPLYNGSRGTFLREPVARIYEERIAAAKEKLSNAHAQEKKEMSRKRVATLAAEIRLRRQSSGYKRLPVIDTTGGSTNERSASVLSRRGGSSASHRRTASSRSRKLHMSTPLPPTVSIPTPPLSGAPRANRVASWESPRRISPIIEDRVETFNRMALYAEGIAEETSTRAVARIVSLGFPESSAKEALRITDMGDGLRVDRAIELLLRRT